MEAQQPDVHRAIAAVLQEILDGAAPGSGWLLNPKDAGLLRSLDALSAEQASAIAAGGTSSIASHVDHLRYGLALLNRWSRGEEPFGDADWGASWRRLEVSEAEWSDLRSRLREEARQWQSGFGQLLPRGEAELTGAIASAAHLAYHLERSARSTVPPAGPRRSRGWSPPEIRCRDRLGSRATLAGNAGRVSF
jgi:hypothetical protein